MELTSDHISDLIKIGVPSVVAIATSIIAWVSQRSLKEKEKELFNLQHSIDKQMFLFENRVKKIEQVIFHMGEYFSSWSTVFSKLGKLDPSKPETMQQLQEAWGKFSEAYNNKSTVISILHTLNAKSCLDVLDDNYKFYAEFYDKHMKANSFPTHEELKDLGFRMGGIRNDFYKEIGKLEEKLSTGA